jgi:hypothetical protein
VVQVDETAICRGLILNNPSNTVDEIPGVQWIVGGVAENSTFDCFMTLVPNRSSTTMLRMFNDFINPGSIIRTDGHRSYPNAVMEFQSIHQVVFYNIGFVNEHNQRIMHLKICGRLLKGTIGQEMVYEGNELRVL